MNPYVELLEAREDGPAALEASEEPFDFVSTYMARSHSQGSMRVFSGGTTGMKPRSSASWCVSLSFGRTS
jgi:hypothetical protein